MKDKKQMEEIKKIIPPTLYTGSGPPTFPTPHTLHRSTIQYIWHCLSGLCLTPAALRPFPPVPLGLLASLAIWALGLSGHLGPWPLVLIPPIWLLGLVPP